MSEITIVLADDHHIVREGLRALLETEPDFSLVGEAADGLEALRLVERLSPNVLITDLMMPGVNGLEVARRVSQDSHQTRVLILSMHADDAYVLEALQNGATGYLLKDCHSASLVQAVRQVAAGRRYLSPPLSDRAIELYLQNSGPTTTDAYNTLTSREREVLQLTIEGHSNAETAEQLFISSRTAETHRANLMRKLGLNGLTDLFRYAVRRGIMRIDD